MATRVGRMGTEELGSARGGERREALKVPRYGGLLKQHSLSFGRWGVEASAYLSGGYGMVLYCMTMDRGQKRRYL